MRKKILNEDASILLLDEMRNYGKLLAEEAVFMADIYQINLDLLEAFDEEKFYTLKKQILTHADKFEKKELLYLIGFLINHATQATRQSDIDLTISNYEIYKLGLEKEVFTEKGFIRPLVLLNYALLCSEVEKANEVEYILTQYQDKIKESFKADTLRLCQAYQCFGKHDFYEAYVLVDDNSKRSISFGLHQKSLQLKCLYELENSSTTHPNIEKTLYDACIAYRRYIQRKSDDLGETAAKAHLNFINLLLKLNNPNTKKEVFEHAMADEHGPKNKRKAMIIWKRDRFTKRTETLNKEKINGIQLIVKPRCCIDIMIQSVYSSNRNKRICLRSVGRCVAII